jgi:hypothetical protein
MTDVDQPPVKAPAVLSSPPPIDHWSQLSNAVTLASTTNQIVWTVFGIFSAADAVLLVALFTTGDLPKSAPGLVVSAVGATMSGAWFLIQLRAIRFLGFYEAIIRELEETHLRVPGSIAVSWQLSDKFANLVGPKFLSVRAIMLSCALGSTLAWLWSICWFYHHRAT